MMTYLIHWLFEMCGSGCWACARGRCKCRHHRLAGDAVLTGILSFVLIHTVG
jgi:hypothetical protein